MMSKPMSLRLVKIFWRRKLTMLRRWQITGFKALSLMLLLALLTVWFTAIPTVKFAGKIIVYVMMCILQFVYLLPLLAMAVVRTFLDNNYTEFMKEVAKVKVVKMKMVKNCKNCRCASHYLFTAHERLDIQLGHHEETEGYEVYEELLDECVVETVTYEAVVYDEMSVFPTSLVLLLYPSCPDVAQYELSTVENLLTDVALDKLPAVEDLSASVDTTGSAMPYYLVRPVIRQRYQLLVDRGKIIR